MRGHPWHDDTFLVLVYCSPYTFMCFVNNIDVLHFIHYSYNVELWSLKNWDYSVLWMVVFACSWMLLWQTLIFVRCQNNTGFYYIRLLLYRSLAWNTVLLTYLFPLFLHWVSIVNLFFDVSLSWISNIFQKIDYYMGIIDQKFIMKNV
jgi:hypothetical protein